MRPLQWHLKDHWFPVVDNPAVQIPLSPECMKAGRWWLQEDSWVFAVALQVPPPSLLLHTSSSLSGWGAHLLDMTASAVWSRDECSVHIDMLEMKAIVLALAVLLPQLSGQSVVLMSDNALVVAYLRNQGGTVSHVCVA